MYRVEAPMDLTSAAEIVSEAAGTEEPLVYWSAVRRAIMQLEPEQAWAAILLLIDAARTPDERGNIGVVVLESFLQEHWQVFVGRLAADAVRHDGLRGALHSVMLTGVPDEVDEVIDSLERRE